MTSAISEGKASVGLIYTNSLPYFETGLCYAKELKLEFPGALSYYKIAIPDDSDRKLSGRLMVIPCSKETHAERGSIELLSCAVERIRGLCLFECGVQHELEIPEIIDGHRYNICIHFGVKISARIIDEEVLPETLQSIVCRAKTELPDHFTDFEAIPSLFYDIMFSVLEHNTPLLEKHVDLFVKQMKSLKVRFHGKDISPGEIKLEMRRFYKSCFEKCSLENLNILNQELKVLKGNLDSNDEIMKIFGSMCAAIGKDALSGSFTHYINTSLSLELAGPKHKEILNHFVMAYTVSVAEKFFRIA